MSPREPVPASAFWKRQVRGISGSIGQSASHQPPATEIVDPAEDTIRDHLLCSLHGGTEAPIERRLMPDASLLDSVVHLLRFARVHRERLFAANVLAGGGGGENDVLVQVIAD